MPPIIPIGGLNGVEPFEPSGTGKPKRRGPQGQENRGDAGYGLQLPPIQLPKLPTLQIPGIQRAGGQVVDLAPDVTDDAPSTAVPFRERPRIEHTKTVSGWIKNLFRDVEDFFAAIPATAKVAWQAGSEILKNYEWLDDLVKNPELLTKELDRTTRRVIKATVDDFSDRWRHGGGEALYKHPFSSMLDILTVFDLAGGALKGAGKLGTKLGSKEAASLAKLGQSIQSYPGRMIAKPFQMTARALEKTPYVGDLLRAKALTPLGKELNALAGAKQLEYVNQAQAKARELFRRGIPKKLWDKHEEFLDGVLPKDLIDDPRILERYDEWMSEVQSAEREFLDFGIMNEERLKNARLQQTAIKLQEKGYFQGELYKLDGDEVRLSDEAMQFAQDWIDGKNPWGKATTPVYRPFQTERTLVQSLEDLFESLRGGEKVGHATGFQSRFQKRTGQNAYVHNPDVWQAKSLLNRARLRASIDFWNEVTARYGKPLKGPTADPGYRIVPPLMKRYVENDIVNAQTMLLQKANEARAALKLAGEADDAKALYQGVRRTREELEAQMDAIQADLKAALDDPKSVMVQVPEEAAYIMDKMVTGPRGFWRWYDNALDTWRDMILTFMPRYYVNNLLGNAVMLFFGGHSPIGKRAAMAEDTIPGEAMQSMLGAEAGNASSFLARPFADAQRPVRRMAEKLAEITDSRARQVFLTTAGKEILEREALIDNTIAQSLLATESAADAVDVLLKARREVLSSPLQELQETRKALKAADGNAAAIEAAMRTDSPDKLYKLRAKAMPGTVRSPEDSAMKEIANLQTQITREKALSNVNPAAAEGRLADLRAQMEMRVKQLEAMTGKTLAETFGAKVLELPDIARLSELQQRRVALAPYAELGEQVIRRMEGFFGNYGRLHPIEREYIRRVIPFWTFARTTFKLAFQLPFLRTKQSFLWHQFAKIMIDAQGDDRLPSRFRTYLPIGGDEEGNIIFLNLKNLNPFEKATEISSFGNIPMPQFLDPRNNPFVKIGVESIGGYDLFTEKPMVSPTQFVSLNGTVFEFDPETKRVEPIIPQKSLIDSVFQQIPHMRILGEILEASGAVKVGSRLRGKATPPINPDGTLTYDRSYMHAIARAAGFPVTIQNPDRVKQQHMMLKRGMARRFRSAANRVDPETRMQLESILRDLERAEVWE